jgi:hypothetical protein
MISGSDTGSSGRGLVLAGIAVLAFMVLLLASCGGRRQERWNRLVRLRAGEWLRLHLCRRRRVRRRAGDGAR